MSSGSYDVVIIGAGIVGAACAAECARGGLGVLIVEPGIIGGGATAAGMGHIVVMDDSEAQFALTQYSQSLWNELSSDLPVEIEHDACGTIWVATDDLELDEVHRKKKFYAARGVAAEILDSRSLEEAEPNLRKGLAGGLLVPHDSVIYPPWAAQFLVNGALECGAHLRLGQAAVKVRREGVCLSDGSQISAGFVINCAGAWSPSLTAGISVQKRKGHLLITDRYPGFLHHQLVELGYLKSAGSVTADSVAFNIQPRKNGQLLIGSSRQYGSEDSKIDSALLGKMLQRAVEYMPALGQLSAIRAWTGFRAATPDKLPLIGPYSEQETLYLATGHEGLGITTSLGTAKLLVDQLLQRNSAIPAEPYMPNRSSQEVVYA